MQDTLYKLISYQASSHAIYYAGEFASYFIQTHERLIPHYTVLMQSLHSGGSSSPVVPPRQPFAPYISHVQSTRTPYMGLHLHSANAVVHARCYSLSATTLPIHSTVRDFWCEGYSASFAFCQARQQLIVSSFCFLWMLLHY